MEFTTESYGRLMKSPGVLRGRLHELGCLHELDCLHEVGPKSAAMKPSEDDGKDEAKSP